MAIELVKEPLRINQAISEGVMQFAVQGDVLIPDIKPDVVKVLYIDGNISTENKETLQDRVIAEGAVNFRIIYQCNDEERPIRALNASLPFKEPIESIGIRPGMKISLDGDILNNEYDVLNERKIFIKAIAQITTRAMDVADISLITDVTGIDDIQKLKKGVKVCSYIGDGFDRCTAKHDVEIPENNPAIFEVLTSNARVTKEVKLTDDKIIVKGEIRIITLYAAEDEENSIQTVECEIPYTQFVDIDGMSEDALCDVDVEVKEVNVRVVEDETGDFRILDYGIDLEFNARGYEWQERHAVTDTYSSSHKMEVESKEVVTSQMVCDLSSQIVVKDSVEVPEDQQITKIYGVISKSAVPYVKVENDKVSVSGILYVWMLYCGGQDNSIKCSKFEIPYNSEIEAKGAEAGMTYKAKVEVERCGFNMVSETEVEIRAVLCTYVKLYKESKVKVVNNIESTDIDKGAMDAQPSIIIYFVQSGDTLWKIGKKYHLAVEDLVKMNNIQNPNELMIGQQVLIPKKIVQNELINK